VSFIDIGKQKTSLLEMREYHFETISFLKSCSSQAHLVPSRTLANRIESSILSPIQYALELIEKIEQIGIEEIPKSVIDRWNLVIEEALISGGEFDEYRD
jgi:hypothetical protein